MTLHKRVFIYWGRYGIEGGISISQIRLNTPRPRSATIYGSSVSGSTAGPAAGERVPLVPAPPRGGVGGVHFRYWERGSDTGVPTGTARQWEDARQRLFPLRVLFILTQHFAIPVAGSACSETPVKLTEFGKRQNSAERPDCFVAFTAVAELGPARRLAPLPEAQPGRGAVPTSRGCVCGMSVPENSGPR